MTIVHLIMTHNYPSPNYLVRFVDLLKYKDDIIYIHVDLKCNIYEFQKYFVNYSNVRFIKNRVKVSWAAYSMVDATVNSFKEIIEEVPDFTFLNLLSGQDYLLKPISFFHEFLKNPEWLLCCNHVMRQQVKSLNFEQNKYWIKELE